MNLTRTPDQRRRATARVVMNRRDFMGVAAAGAVVGACSGPTEGATPEADIVREATPSSFRESPMLAERVRKGKLAPLEERLPKEPYVVNPGVLVDDADVHMRPGRFGGTLRLGQESQVPDPVISIGLTEPMIWAPNGFDYVSGIEGNVVESWEVSKDDSVYTFRIRDGLKWSDGVPVTIDDVRFAFDDVLYNKEITDVFPDYLYPGKTTSAPPARLQVVDDLTFRMVFDRPYGMFPAQLAIFGWCGYEDIIKPRHYLEQFHAKYASKKKLSELVKKASLPEGHWAELFNAKQRTSSMRKATSVEGVPHPTLMPWILKKANGDVLTYERNPYYFKVDTRGNQLPYVDFVRSHVVQRKETLSPRTLPGDFDYLGEAAFRTFPVMAEKAKKGDARLLVSRQHLDPTTIFLNLTHEDRTWRRVVRDLRFRQALSLALDRDEIIQNFYLGRFAGPPTETNPVEHDPRKADLLLDEMGLDRRDADGWRIGPDGTRFVIPLAVSDLSENHLPAGELVTDHWRDVGLYAKMRQIDGRGWQERRARNQLKATIFWVHHPLWRGGGHQDYLPMNNWGPLWQLWHDTQGQEGEEPPGLVQELFDLHHQFMSSRLKTPESVTAIQAIIQSHRDNLWMLNLMEGAYSPTLFDPRVKNVATGMKRDVFGIIVTYSMEQWYLSTPGAADSA